MTESLLNKLSFELAQRRAVERTGQTTGPGILVSGTALFGTPYSGNDRRFETHTEFAELLNTAQEKAEIRVVLVSAAGVRPKNGEITDIFLHGSEGARKLSFFDLKQVVDYELLFGRKPDPQEREAHVINREAATR